MWNVSSRHHQAPNSRCRTYTSISIRMQAFSTVLWMASAAASQRRHGKTEFTRNAYYRLAQVLVSASTQVLYFAWADKRLYLYLLPRDDGIVFDWYVIPAKVSDQVFWAFIPTLGYWISRLSRRILVLQLAGLADCQVPKLLVLPRRLMWDHL